MSKNKKKRLNERGMVLSGVTILLILPAMLISATFFTTIEIGSEGTSIQQFSDSASYIAYDVKQTFRKINTSRENIDNEIINKVIENYNQNTFFEIKTKNIPTENDNILLNITIHDPQKTVYYNENFKLNPN